MITFFFLVQYLVVTFVSPQSVDIAERAGGGILDTGIVSLVHGDGHADLRSTSVTIASAEAIQSRTRPNHVEVGLAL